MVWGPRDQVPSNVSLGKWFKRSRERIAEKRLDLVFPLMQRLQHGLNWKIKQYTSERSQAMLLSWEKLESLHDVRHSTAQMPGKHETKWHSKNDSALLTAVLSRFRRWHHNPLRNSILCTQMCLLPLGWAQFILEPAWVCGWMLSHLCGSKAEGFKKHLPAIKKIQNHMP